jgi:hypothetical protein
MGTVEMSNLVGKIKARGVALRDGANKLARKVTGNRRSQAERTADQGGGRLKRAKSRFKAGVGKLTGLVRRGK